MSENKENNSTLLLYGESESCRFMLGRSRYGTEVRFYLLSDDHPLTWEGKEGFYLASLLRGLPSPLLGKGAVKDAQWSIVFVYDENESKSFFSLLKFVTAFATKIDDIWRAGISTRAFFGGEVPEACRKNYKSLTYFETKCEIGKKGIGGMLDGKNH